jgi:hypothetical protein
VKKGKDRRYLAVSSAGVLFVFASEAAQIHAWMFITMDFRYPVFFQVLRVLTPIIESILIFLKLSLLNKTLTYLSVRTDIFCTVVFIGGVALLHSFVKPQHLYLPTFIFDNPLIIFVFSFQLCVLVYALIKKQQIRNNRKASPY